MTRIERGFSFHQWNGFPISTNGLVRLLLESRISEGWKRMHTGKIRLFQRRLTFDFYWVFRKWLFLFTEVYASCTQKYAHPLVHTMNMNIVKVKYVVHLVTFCSRQAAFAIKNVDFDEKNVGFLFTPLPSETFFAFQSDSFI